MVISDNLYQFGVAIDSARREWEINTGKKADLEDWAFRDFLAAHLSQRGVMIKSIGDIEVEAVIGYNLMSQHDAQSFRNTLAAACGCSQVYT